MSEKLPIAEPEDLEYQPIQPIQWSQITMSFGNVIDAFGTPNGSEGNLHWQVAAFLAIYAILKAYVDLDGYWLTFTEKFNSSNDHFLLTAILGFLVTSAVYWIASLIYTAFEFYPGASKFKLQPEHKTPLADLGYAAKNVLINQIVVNFPLSVMYWFIMNRAGWSITDPFPSVWRLALDFVVIALVDEVLLYVFHRVCHTRTFWRFHKVHHHFKSPTAIAAVAAHPVEQLLVNTVPLLTGPIIMHCHFAVLVFWISAAQVAAIHSHCGHWYPTMDTPALHDMHHKVGYCNYGPFGIIDRLVGTYKQPPSKDDF